MSTKDIILYKALIMFSEKGYEGVSMRDIASEVGIKAASIYNHFKNKEDIFNSLIKMMDERYKEFTNSMNTIGCDASEDAKVYLGIKEEELQIIVKKMFLYFLKDEYAAPFRRMLTAEYYRSSKAKTTYIDLFINGVIKYQSTIFRILSKQGYFVECDPEIAAYQFYSPIILLLYKYDLKEDKEEEVLKILENHVHQFSMLYTKK